MNLSTAQRGKIVQWIREARTRMRLETSSILLDWDRKKKSGSAMEIVMSWEYKQGRITVYEQVVAEEWSKYGDSWIESICYHEVVHALLMEIDEYAGNRYVSKVQLNGAFERLTEKLVFLLLPKVLDVQYTKVQYTKSVILKKKNIPKGKGSYGHKKGRPSKKKK